ncbi:aromatic ring-hydroxylating dioxygenase subunit alpha [Novosphingobium sp. ERN07]|uniref:aromatic ring-hydroxylating oxygenase subunit alpha n=1 Tax=Novosphingobium sp. ERN07 TaxID=2726187 RepID=UPI001456FBA1|nr:aromatic ring-hydroxylating dioxygenase subunit alpha [Novosphingobium sp. ERN07]NLR72786.1 aromatic ring-hydroxylating dioxygenase subunit alpha [Novosphingobium sp. ERN07]
MNDLTSALPAPERNPVSAGIVPARNYISPEFARKEAEGLWSRVWQMACREEEIPKIGDYYTYDIVDQSIIVIRTAADEIKAFHNVCPHRGRTITEGCGHANRLFCKYHGWNWKIDGTGAKVVDRHEWPADELTDDALNLAPVNVGRWSGWVYVNMDPDCVSLEEHLSPAKDFLDPFDLGGLRYHWRKSTVLDCNWKVALEAFDEGYHVQTTHNQMLRYFDDWTQSYAHGRHAHFGYWESMPMGSRSPRLTGGAPTEDIRPGIRDYMEDMAATLNAGSAVQTVHAARRVEQEVEPGTPAMEVLMKFGQFIYEHALSLGLKWPDITAEQMQAAGIDWHLFPNQIMLMGPTGSLNYRARPVGSNPDKCIFDVYSLQRYPEGEAPPKVELEWSQDHADTDFWGLILTQDFANVAEVQKGMKSKGFKGARPNPRQEIAISNFHRALEDFVENGYAGEGNPA